MLMPVTWWKRRGRGRPKKYWEEVIRHDMPPLQLIEDMTLEKEGLEFADKDRQLVGS